MYEKGWNLASQRNYGGRLAKPDEFHGVMKCANHDLATAFRYNLRSHFEWDFKVQTGYANKGQVNIMVNPDNSVNWYVVK